MILIRRGEEPSELKDVRTAQLQKLSTLGRTPTADDISGYACVKESLRKAQYGKCCYCEYSIGEKFNDVEHYRPKGRAIRHPGCELTHGYWWLSFTWENLLFACSECNRIEKNDLFPLEKGSVSLREHEVPPGQEKCLLLNPAEQINPIEHIMFVFESESRGMAKHWRAKPRNTSQLGNFSISVFGLNTKRLYEARDDYYELTIKHRIQQLETALKNQDTRAILEQYKECLRLLLPGQRFVALTYDVLQRAIPNSMLEQTIGQTWPSPSEIPLLTPPIF